MISQTNKQVEIGGVGINDDQQTLEAQVDLLKFNQCLVSVQKINSSSQLKSEDLSPKTPKPILSYDEIEFYLAESQVDCNEESKEAKPCKLIIVQDMINLIIPYPFKPGQILMVKQTTSDVSSQSTFSQVIDQVYNPLEGLSIDINQVKFNSDLKAISENFTDSKTGSQFKITFELQKNQQLHRQNTNKEGERYYKFDFSATNLPLKPKKFSFFKSSPLISFYEIVSLNPETKGQVVYESDISKIESTDPFWTLTEPLAHTLLSPIFEVNIYQSIDKEKTKRALISTLTVSMDQILGEEKETMFEVPGTKGHTVLMLDRIQDVTATIKQQ